MSRLARRYRWLLLGYPRAYRRARAEEIVNTLVDLAPSERTRPTFREAVNLLRNGLRCRLGRPASRTVVVWAALTALVWGLFTAAFATRLAWETAKPLPSPAEATPLLTQLLPGHDLTGKVERSPAMFVVYGSAVGPKNVRDILFGDGGEYSFGSTGAALDGLPAAELEHAFQADTEWLRRSGWDVEQPVVTREPGPIPTTQMRVAARRGADIVQLDLLTQPTMSNTHLGVSINRATPWAVYPAGVAAGLIGAAVAWLVFGWASRRTEGRHGLLRVLAGCCFGIATFLWTSPIVLSAPSLLRHQLGEHHFRWHPLWEWLGQPFASLPFLVGTGLALIALATVALPRRTPSDVTGPVPAT
jgi:hypothetical protein